MTAALLLVLLWGLMETHRQAEAYGNTDGGDINLKVLYQNGNTDPNGSSVVPRLMIRNDGEQPVDLARIKVRYWFNNREGLTQQFWCDWAWLNCSNIKGQFIGSKPVKGANNFLEMSFVDSAGWLNARSDTGLISIRFNHTDWSQYKQESDYSFNRDLYAGFNEWDHITLYLDGQLVWGNEPSKGQPQPQPTATPEPKPTTQPQPTATPKPQPQPTATPAPNPGPGSTNFVSRSGSQLFLNNQPFRFSGPNIYWLGLDENMGGVAYPTHYRIEDVLQAAHDMGATVVRSHTLGVSVGCSLCLEPSLGQFNDAAFEPIDYAIQQASKQGLRLIIPLVDQWHYYHGGKHTFTSWRGYQDVSDQTWSHPQQEIEGHFYSDPTVIGDFKAYVSHILNHKNQYTGQRLGDDPTIMAWETGNEIYDAPAGWTQDMASFIKSLAPHHLVSDGSAANGLHITTLRVQQTPSVDIYGGHFYPLDWGWMATDAAQVKAAGKVYYIGEYPATDQSALTQMLPAIERTAGVAGDTWWSLFGRDGNGGWEQHSDGYTLHYPGTNDAERQAVNTLKDHALKMSVSGQSS